jgi:NTP pyrophosphatase (non-canonical NTP hydrolase)
MTISTFNAYAAEQAKTAIYPQEMIAYPFLGLAGETGEVSELAKKCIRDENGVWSDERKDKLKKELGDVLWYLSEIARRTGLSLEDIATTNVEKLRSRQERGVLKGSGNDR